MYSRVVCELLNKGSGQTRVCGWPRVKWGTGKEIDTVSEEKRGVRLTNVSRGKMWGN